MHAWSMKKHRMGRKLLPKAFFLLIANIIYYQITHTKKEIDKDNQFISSF